MNLKPLLRQILPGPVHRRVQSLYRHVVGRQSVRRIYYYGVEKFCPVCRSHIRSFVAHHSDPARRFDSLCPVCGCKGPHRRDWLFLENYCTQMSMRARVLHIAPEPHLGPRLAALPEVEYVSGDIRRGVGQFQFDICCLPFKDESFDLVYCCHVLNALPDDAAAIREMFRVLRHPGLAVIEHPVAQGRPTLEPATAGERDRVFHDAAIFRLYGDDYRTRLSSGGFSIEENTFVKGISAVERDKMDLYSGIGILCRK